MTLRSPNHPEIEDVEGAIEYYYVTKHKAIRKIAEFLGLSYTQVRGALQRRQVELRRHQGSRTEDGERECTCCHNVYPLIEKYWHRDTARPSGFAYKCKICRRNE